MSYYAAVVLAEPSLVSYWVMPETQGTTMVDFKGSNHGTYHGGVVLNRNGPYFTGASVFFDGFTAFAEVPSDVAFHTTVPPFNNAYSVEMWLYQFDPQPVPFAPWGFRNGGVPAGVWGLETFSGGGPSYTALAADTGGILALYTTQSPPTYGAWHHCVETYDGVSVKAYRDGVLVSAATPILGFAGQFPSNPFSIGGIGPNSYDGLSPPAPFSGNPFFYGLISNVAYYYTALGATQVLDHYNAAFLAAPPTGSVYTKAATATAVFTASATAVRLAAHVGKVSVTQVVVEAARLQLDGFVHVTQVVVEVLLPFVAGGTGTFAVDAAASVVFHASAVGHRAFRVTAGPTSVVFTATGNGFHGLYKKAAATVVFTATAVLNNSARGATAHCTVVFRCRAKNKFRPIVFGDDYLGRFQLGQEVPLWDLVRDQHGTPALPTAVPPVAEVYNLDTRVHVEGVEMTRLRGARTDSVYVKPLRLSAIYTLGRHAVVYRAVTGGFVGYNVAIFEVVAGGDPSGPAFASHTLAAPAGDQVVAQLGSGALAKGSRPRVS